MKTGRQAAFFEAVKSSPASITAVQVDTRTKMPGTLSPRWVGDLINLDLCTIVMF